MAAVTLDGLKALADRGIIVIANISAGELLTAWSLTATRTYTYECTPTQRLTIHGPKDYDRVLIDAGVDDTGAGLTLQSSIATVEANPGSFWWDSATGKLYVHTEDSSAIWLHAIVADFKLFVSSGHYRIGEGVYFNSHLYWPLIQGVSTISREIADLFEPRIITSSCEIFLTCGYDWRNIFRAYRWSNRSIQILAGGEDLPYSEYDECFTGLIRNRRWVDDSISLEIKDNTVLFNTAFPPRRITAEDVEREYDLTYPAGDIYLNEPASIAPDVDIDASALTEDAAVGEVWPFIFGRQLNIVPRVLAVGAGIAMALGDGLGFLHDFFFSGAGGTSWNSYTWDGFAGGSSFGSLAGINLEYGLGYFGPTIADGRNYYTIASGPIDDSVEEFPEGPVEEMAVDAAIRATDLCNLGLTWNTTESAESRFLTSLMEIQAYVTDKDATLADFLADLGKSTGSVVYQDNAGEMHFRTMSPDYRNATNIDEAWGDFVELDAQVEQEFCFTKVIVEYGQFASAPILPSGSATKGLVKMAEANCPEYAAESASGAVKSITGTYLKTEAGAKCLANRIARWGANEPLRIRISTTFRHLTLDIGSNVYFTRTTRPIADDTYTLYGTVVGVGIELSTATIYLDIMERFQDRQAYIGAASSPAWGSATAAQRRALGFLTDDDGLAAAANNAAYKTSLEW